VAKKKGEKRRTETHSQASEIAVDLGDPGLYINRELSWLQFNHRVLEEALDQRHPLLERVKFLAIFANNLDEFFMIRVSGLRRQLAGGVLEAPPDGMTPAEQLAAIRRQLLPELARQYDCWRYDLLPRLREAGIKVLDFDELKRKQRKLLRQYFEREIFPALTPLAFDPGHPFPHISNLSINLAVVINDPAHGQRFARLKVPATFPRLLRIPSEETAESYQSLGVDFVREAARDPAVLAIKQTLYRIGPDSPIVATLMEARENGKQVAVLVELKARFDEENNIGWARALEQAGVHVVYGLVGLKTHAKICLVVRRERDGITRYVHMSTGNYNGVTARVYTDLGYFTSDPAIGADVSDLFNALTGYSRRDEYRKLLVSPGMMQQQIIERIEREIERHRQHGDGYLAFKMNALVDKPCIQALYRASQAGVRVDLQVRGICCLRPGVPGVSDHITVTSIVGRFLEHARIFYFRNGGEEEILVGSADLMPRNLYRRVENLFPVEDPHLRDVLRDTVLGVHLKDTVQARRLLPDGSYERVRPGPDEPELNSQLWMVEHWGTWQGEE